MSSRFSTGIIAGAFLLGSAVALMYGYRHGFFLQPPAPPPVTDAAPVPAPGLERIEANSRPSKADEPQDPEAALANAGIGARATDPAELMAKVGEALESGDLSAAGKLIGSGALTPEARKRLAEMAGSGGLRLRQPAPVQEVGGNRPEPEDPLGPVAGGRGSRAGPHLL